MACPGPASPGAEDVNWFNVQLSRARQDTRLYAVVGPEPHEAAGELDLPEVERGDAFGQFNRALGKDGSQYLALDTASTPDPRWLSTRELRGERDRLAGRLAEAPRDRGRELDRATQRREQAEAELPPPASPPPCFAAGEASERAGVQAGAEAVARPAGDRATRREQELRAHQQRRAGWLDSTLAWSTQLPAGGAGAGLAAPRPRPGVRGGRPRPPRLPA